MPTNTITSDRDVDRQLVTLRWSAEAVARSAHRVLGGSATDDQIALLWSQIEHLQGRIDAIRGDDATLLADLDRWLESLRRRVEGHPVHSRLEVGVS